MLGFDQDRDWRLRTVDHEKLLGENSEAEAKPASLSHCEAWWPCTCPRELRTRADSPKHLHAVHSTSGWAGGIGLFSHVMGCHGLLLLCNFLRDRYRRPSRRAANSRGCICPSAFCPLPALSPFLFYPSADSSFLTSNISRRAARGHVQNAGVSNAGRSQRSSRTHHEDWAVKLLLR